MTRAYDRPGQPHRRERAGTAAIPNGGNGVNLNSPRSPSILGGASAGAPQHHLSERAERDGVGRIAEQHHPWAISSAPTSPGRSTSATAARRDHDPHRQLRQRHRRTGPGANLIAENSFSRCPHSTPPVSGTTIQGELDSTRTPPTDHPSPNWRNAGNHRQDLNWAANWGRTGALHGVHSAITGNLDSSLNQTYVIRFYRSAIRSPSGSGEGETYLGLDHRGHGRHGHQPGVQRELRSAHRR